MSLAPGQAYTYEARARISQLSRDEVAHFLDLVPRPAARAVLRRLPPIRGFRADSDAGAEEQKRQLARRLTENQGELAQERDWAILRQLWWLWVQMRMAGSPLLEAARAYIEAPLDDVGAIDELLLVCISDAENQNVSREAFIDFFKFAPFLDTKDAAEVISTASPDSELKDKQFLANLRPTVKTLESQMILLRESVNALTEQSASIVEIQKEMDDFIASTKHASVASEHRLSRIEETMAKNAMGLEAIRADIAELAPQLRGLASIQSALKNHDDAIERLELARSEGRLVNASGNAEASDFTNYVPSMSVSSKRHQVKSAADLFVGLQQNFTTLGLDRDAVGRLTITTLAGLCAGQLVCFKGPFSSLFLSAVTPMVTELARVVDVQLGYHDERVVRQVVDEKSVPFQTVIFIGANRGAFDLYAAFLVEDVVMRQVNLPARCRVVAFATLTDGTSSIPISSTLAAIGPIIDSSGLALRRNKKDTPTLACASLPVAPWDLRSWESTMPEFVSAALKLLIDCRGDFRNIAQLGVRNVGSILQALISENMCSASDAELALLSSWCIPYMLASGAPPEQIRKKIAASDLAEHMNHAAVSSLLEARIAQA